MGSLREEVGMKREGGKTSGTTRSLSRHHHKGLKGDSGVSLANIGLLWRPCLWFLLAFDMLIGVKFQNVGKGNPLVIP